MCSMASSSSSQATGEHSIYGLGMEVDVPAPSVIVPIEGVRDLVISGSDSERIAEARQVFEGLQQSIKEGDTHVHKLLDEITPPVLKNVVVHDVDRCLIGYFGAGFPGTEALQKLLRRWKTPCKYFHHWSGWLVFEFENVDDAEKVLEGDTYFACRKILALKKMPKLFDVDNDVLSKMPLWIKLPSLPSGLWNCCSTLY